MKSASPYLKMQVIGAIENAPGKSRRERILNVAKLVFLDEEGQKRQFTWRTISTWYYRYKSTGITGMMTKERKDKGVPRSCSPEEVLEAINEVKAFFKPGSRPSKAAMYRMCIERGILQAERIAYNTFSRTIKTFDLLDESRDQNPRRLAFAMEYANDLWQADTMFGPYVNHNGKKVQAKLIAFIDDASRVLCHGQFFPDEKIDSLMEALRNAFYKRGIPRQLYVDNGSIYCSAELTLVCARVGCILRHTPVRDGVCSVIEN